MDKGVVSVFVRDRACDLKSRQEKKISRALLWLGATDIREQFPIWPWPHAHPLTGAPGAEHLVLDGSPGLMDIANPAKISHGVAIGTTLPYIATVCFRLSYNDKGATFILIGILAPSSMSSGH